MLKGSREDVPLLPGLVVVLFFKQPIPSAIPHANRDSGHAGCGDRPAKGVDAFSQRRVHIPQDIYRTTLGDRVLSRRRIEGDQRNSKGVVLMVFNVHLKQGAVGGVTRPKNLTVEGNEFPLPSCRVLLDLSQGVEIMGRRKADKGLSCRGERTARNDGRCEQDNCKPSHRENSTTLPSAGSRKIRARISDLLHTMCGKMIALSVSRVRLPLFRLCLVIYTAIVKDKCSSAALLSPYHRLLSCWPRRFLRWLNGSPFLSCHGVLLGVAR